MVVLEGSNTVLVGIAVLFPHTQMARTVLAQFSVVIILFDVICFCVMQGGK
jgi:hypothetical protein